jgi:hypothetical protein
LSQPGLTGLALAPDAAKLAVTADPFTAPVRHVFTVATGAERCWDGPGPVPGSARAPGELTRWRRDILGTGSWLRSAPDDPRTPAACSGSAGASSLRTAIRAVPC